MADDTKFQGELIGYARVSTEEQSDQMQIDALVAGGIPAANIFTDTMTGARMDRPALKRALKVARRGDVLVVWKLDRLGRSVRGVLDAVEALQAEGVGLRSLTEPIDTTTPWGKMVMTVLLALAEMERNLISERTKAGVKAYIERGGKMGQPHRIRDFPKRLARFTELWEAGHIPDGKLSGQDIVNEMNQADPKAPQIKGPQMYFNWKKTGFKGFQIPEVPLDETEPE